MQGKRTSRVQYPDNLKIRAKLQTNDKIRIALSSGYKEGSIREMLNGYRKFPDKVKVAIIALLKEREELNKSLEEIANQ